jgi:signal transduction histidine kinase
MQVDHEVVDLLLTILKTHSDILQKAPVAILLVDRSGKVLSANHAAKRSIGTDPTGKRLHELFDEEVANRRMLNVTRAIERGEMVVDEDARDFRHFLTYYRPIPPLDVCVVMAREITGEVRVRNLLRIAQNIRETLLHSRDLDALAERVGRTLLNVEGAAHVRVELLRRRPPPGGERVATWEAGTPGEYSYTFPLSVASEEVGKVVLSLARELSHEERGILSATLDDVAYNVKLAEMREILAHNIVEIARIIDGIRNPLAAILLNAELYGESELREKVKEQVQRITTLLRSLDEKWIESEKILNFLRVISSPPKLP